MKTYDISEAAEFLKVDRSTVLNLAGRGDLPGAKIGRAWVFLEDELVDYLRAKTREQTRHRQAESRVEEDLHSSARRQDPGLSPLRVRRRTPGMRPNLPELVSERASP